MTSMAGDPACGTHGQDQDDPASRPARGEHDAPQSRSPGPARDCPARAEDTSAPRATGLRAAELKPAGRAGATVASAARP